MATRNTRANIANMTLAVKNQRMQMDTTQVQMLRTFINILGEEEWKHSA